MIVQIYEIQSPSEAEQMLALGVDHIGSVVLSAASWREPQLRDTLALVNASGAVSSLIPLFDEPDIIWRVVEYYRPAVLHFCNALPAAIDFVPACWQQARALQVEARRRFPQLKLMRSVPIAPPGRAVIAAVLALTRFFETASDFFLTDTLLDDSPEQPVSGFVGITGRICDWQVAAALVQASTVPVILAGGITPENVASGIAQVRPAGVDSCTGTNLRDANGRTRRFHKDPQRVARLVAEARHQAMLTTQRI